MILCLNIRGRVTRASMYSSANPTKADRVRRLHDIGDTPPLWTPEMSMSHIPWPITFFGHSGTWPYHGKHIEQFTCYISVGNYASGSQLALRLLVNLRFLYYNTILFFAVMSCAGAKLRQILSFLGWCLQPDDASRWTSLHSWYWLDVRPNFLNCEPLWSKPKIINTKARRTGLARVSCTNDRLWIIRWSK